MSGSIPRRRGRKRSRCFETSLLAAKPFNPVARRWRPRWNFRRPAGAPWPPARQNSAPRAKPPVAPKAPKAPRVTTPSGRAAPFAASNTPIRGVGQPAGPCPEGANSSDWAESSSHGERPGEAPGKSPKGQGGACPVCRGACFGGKKMAVFIPSLWKVRKKLDGRSRFS